MSKGDGNDSGNSEWSKPTMWVGTNWNRDEGTAEERENRAISDESIGFFSDIRHEMKENYNEKPESDFRVWNFSDPPIEKVVFDKFGEEMVSNISVKEQMEYLREKKMFTWEEDLFKEDTRTHARTETFNSIFSSLMINPCNPEINDRSKVSELKKEFSSNFENSTLDKMKELENNCVRILAEMKENKKYILSRLEGILDSQITSFEEKVFKNVQEHRSTFLEIEEFESKFEEKIRKGDVFFTPSKSLENPFSNLILKCSDVLNIIFSFLHNNDLFLRVSPTCSFFLKLILENVSLKLTFGRAGGKYVIPDSVEKSLSRYNIQELTFDSGWVYINIPNFESLKEKSKLITLHQDQLRAIYIKSQFDVEERKDLNSQYDNIHDDSWHSWNNKERMKKQKRYENNLFFSELIAKCDKLETLRLSVVPSDMKNLKFLKYLEVDLLSPCLDVIDTDITTLTEYFRSTKRYHLQTLLLERDEKSWGGSVVRKYSGSKLFQLYESIRKSCDCGTLKMLYTRLHFEMKDFSEDFVVFLCKLENVRLRYYGWEVNVVNWDVDKSGKLDEWDFTFFKPVAPNSFPVHNPNPFTQILETFVRCRNDPKNHGNEFRIRFQLNRDRNGQGGIDGERALNHQNLSFLRDVMSIPKIDLVVRNTSFQDCSFIFNHDDEHNYNNSKNNKKISCRSLDLLFSHFNVQNTSGPNGLTVTNYIDSSTIAMVEISYKKAKNEINYQNSIQCKIDTVATRSFDIIFKRGVNDLQKIVIGCNVSRGENDVCIHQFFLPAILYSLSKHMEKNLTSGIIFPLKSLSLNFDFSSAPYSEIMNEEYFTTVYLLLKKIVSYKLLKEFSLKCNSRGRSMEYFLKKMESPLEEVKKIVAFVRKTNQKFRWIFKKPEEKEEKENGVKEGYAVERFDFVLDLHYCNSVLEVREGRIVKNEMTEKIPTWMKNKK